MKYIEITINKSENKFSLMISNTSIGHRNDGIPALDRNLMFHVINKCDGPCMYRWTQGKLHCICPAWLGHIKTNTARILHEIYSGTASDIKDTIFFPGLVFWRSRHAE